MDAFTIALWVGTGIFLIISIVKDKGKTKRALKMAFGIGKGMLLSIVSIILIIGIVLAILPPQQIAEFVQRQNIALATVVAAAFGTITIIPAFIAFPLIGTLVNAGVGIVPSVSFLTTLTMVGVVTFPLEKKQFGLKFAIARNSLSFLFAIVIALIMGMII